MPQTTPRSTVLVVDDEPELRALLAEYFGRNGFIVMQAENAAVARERVAEQVPDAAVLDINMPGENGLSLARALRESHPQLGLVMLTTAGEAIDRIVGLEVGADDYVAKPFELRELLARVRAVLRRLQVAATAAPAPANSHPDRVPFGICQLDVAQRKLFGAEGQEIDITAAEFDLLALFARHPNRPLNRDQIMEQAHNRGWDVFRPQHRPAHHAAASQDRAQPRQARGHQDRAQRRLRLRAGQPLKRTGTAREA